MLAIKVEALSKRYELNNAGSSWRKHTKAASLVPAKQTIWALKDVSLEVSQGEAVGIIGRNGSGKSTLLKILSQVVKPTSGSAVLRGRRAALLELGAGFHPDLTGRENVQLSGHLLGMRSFEIEEQFDRIVEFAELAQFIDTPIKRYSSGMYIRLAFSVAAFLRPDILIVDEVLAVGDAGFKLKCLGKLEELSAGAGRTVLYVSHELETIHRFCSRVLVLDRGRVSYDGPTDQGIREYLSLGEPKIEVLQTNLGDRLNRANGKALFKKVSCLDGRGNPTWTHAPGATIRLEFEYTVLRPVSDMVVMLLIRLTTPVSNLTALRKTISEGPMKVGAEGSVTFELSDCPLTEGFYSVYAILMSADYSTGYDIVDQNVDLPNIRITGGAATPFRPHLLHIGHTTRGLSTTSAAARGRQ